MWNVFALWFLPVSHIFWQSYHVKKHSESAWISKPQLSAIDVLSSVNAHTAVDCLLWNSGKETFLHLQVTQHFHIFKANRLFSFLDLLAEPCSTRVFFLTQPKVTVHSYSKSLGVRMVGCVYFGKMVTRMSCHIPQRSGWCFLAVQMSHHHRCSCTRRSKWGRRRRWGRKRLHLEWWQQWQRPSSPFFPLLSHSCYFRSHFQFDRQCALFGILARHNIPRCSPSLWNTRHHSLQDLQVVQTSFHLAFWPGFCNSCGRSSRSALSSPTSVGHSKQGTGLHVLSCRYFQLVGKPDYGHRASGGWPVSWASVVLTFHMRTLTANILKKARRRRRWEKGDKCKQYFMLALCKLHIHLDSWCNSMII